MTVSLSTPPSQEYELYTSRELRPPNFEAFKLKEIKGGHHRASVRCLGWSTDARRLASGGTDKVVRVWTPERSLAERSGIELRGHNDTVDALSWDPTHPERLATASSDKTVRVWDIRSQTAVMTTQTPGANINLTFHPKGHLIAVGNREDVLSLIDLRAGGKIQGTIKPSPSNSTEEINELAWSNSGSLFVASTGTGYVRVLDARSHNDADVPKVANESATAKNIPAEATATIGDATKATNGGESHSHAASNSSVSAPVIPWNPVYTLVAHTATIFCTQFDPVGRYLATASADATVGCWTVPDFQTHWTSGKDLNYPPRSLSFSHDGEYLAAGGEDPFVWIGSTVNGATVHKVPTQSMTINALAWNPTKHILAYAGEEKVPGQEGAIRIWGL
ncbi:unnamed protein product [Parajaminaea phylloscopi]